MSTQEALDWLETARQGARDIVALNDGELIAGRWSKRHHAIMNKGPLELLARVDKAEAKIRAQEKP